MDDERWWILRAMSQQICTMLHRLLWAFYKWHPSIPWSCWKSARKEWIAVILELRARDNTSWSCCTPMWRISPKHSSIGIYQRQTWRMTKSIVWYPWQQSGLCSLSEDSQQTNVTTRVNFVKQHREIHYWCNNNTVPFLEKNMFSGQIGLCTQWGGSDT